MTQTAEKPFGKLRSFLWPIHMHELKKVLPMFLMFFCISFNYTILRDTKDTLIVTAPGSGAEAIPFIKLWLVVPSAVVFMLIYAKLSNILSKQALFYAVLSPFVVFFALFPLVIYPYRHILHPTDFADTLQAILPSGFLGFIAMLRNWTFAAFYVLSELWGSVMLSLMFWGFANEITKISEAKRFYALFGVGANVALLISGPAIVWSSKLRASLGEGVDPWGVTLYFLMAMFLCSCAIIAACYWWMNRYVLTDPRFYNPAELKAKKSKPKMSMGESFSYLLRSPYMLLLALLVICYGVCINLVEVTWKSQLKMQFPNPNEYSAFMGTFSFWTGVVSVFVMLFIGGNVIRRFGWLTGALVTPVMVLVTGAIFFALVIFRDHATGLVAALGTTPLMLAVVVGAVQNILSKSTKYALFDATKEMAYIPLDQEQKVKGKAAIDVVAARFGKSGGSLIQQGLLVVCGSISAMTPFLAVALFAIIMVWLTSATKLNKLFLAASAAKEQELAEATAAAEKEASPAAKEVSPAIEGVS
ncbi:ADP,ATP carrier protein 1 [Chlamydia muridarum str. Nigg]|jgi:ADP/ATP carrier protein family|uniref:ADP,ATP carrier protein 1 n=2 Tax=Chlamydia muridarum TaxID=83560 RepID=TLC1_CHLMU|nr:NTP/NDP exchange transporter Npt1 [Chlamydia muridarum]Q9PKX5.1 RecName: Full=ADP,ATP carrier protein 1; AltName: Full=ADP/ATP translocase 1 [Chlamydia muridarum str. Nigg]AAF39198.1 ADP, ATP carrier protein [Chlamydia muridarum str. Nigg]AHH22725.1 ATPase AAA [Chlamydia muridarum str. Nigg3 CMUT3-5]AHH23650.1 ATPase AAA [Chlamydia muridarum str. Nigg CM972]AID37867.1 ATPase AAA [Chlamydia muridarum str. Nigg 2 MCR]AIT90534.1 ATPase AAA [Chlamydia muridarum]